MTGPRSTRSSPDGGPDAPRPRDGAFDGGEVALAALWLAAQQRIVARCAHEIMNALNGIAVNLEVVRSRAGRSEREGAPAAGIASFAGAAAGQLEALTALTQGVLAVTRATRAPADVATVAAQFEAVLAPVAAVGGGSLTVEAAGELGFATAAPADAVRLALGVSLLAAAEGGGHVRCRIERDAGSAPSGDGRALPVVVALAGELGDGALLPADVASAVADAGIVVAREGGVLRLSFPAAGQ